MVLDNILNIIDLYKYVTIVNVTPEANNIFIIIALVIKIEVFKILGF